jgi:hypothetical protein
MNTPHPCDTCDNLYWDCMQEDDPFYFAECKLELQLGNKNCPQHPNNRTKNRKKENNKYFKLTQEIQKEIGYIDDVRNFCCFTCHHRHKVAACCFCEKHKITISLLGKCIFWIKRK